MYIKIYIILSLIILKLGLYIYVHLFLKFSLGILIIDEN